MNRENTDVSLRLSIYKRILYVALILGIVLTLLSAYYTLWMQIPSTIMVKAGTTQTLDFNIPVSGIFYKDAVKTGGNIKSIQDGQRIASKSRTSRMFGSKQMKENADSPQGKNTGIAVDFGSPVTVKANRPDTYKLQLKLFGVLPFKEASVEVIRDIRLKPAGIPVGIYVKTEGVLVIGIGEFEGEDGQTKTPAKYILKAGDYILEMNDEEITGKKQLIEKISHCEGQEVIFKIRREMQEFEVRAKPMLNRNGEYKMGIWVRDNAQGVGTMTYIDENGCFGALGHGINDVDTGTLMKLKDGTLYNTEIIGITRGKKGAPGELTGFIEYDNRNILGRITHNTAKGIFGICENEVIEEADRDFLSIGLKQEIVTGPAQIICSLGDEVQSYEVEITDIHLENDNVNRGIVLEITDSELLAATGGIVQGMSGSPIVQNGRIVGAVTHVLVNDPTRGYGIFIENMLEH